jgi:cobalt-zinc-cadmium efflux system outer membrane protein
MCRYINLTGLLLLSALPASAQQRSDLTFENALARARQSAPAIVAARMRIDEARGRVIGASLPLTNNPTIDAAAGRRDGTTSTTQYEVEVAQDLDLPVRRRARIDAAHAVVTQEEQRARHVEREVLRDVATTFLRAVEARERTDAAGEARRLAEEALRIAERRFAAGDVAQLDVNLARTAVARAEADQRSTAALLAGQVTQLRILLDISSAEPITVSGSLRDPLALALRADDLAALAADRADLRLLDAEIAEAEAEQRVARTLRWPDVRLRGSYSHEEGDRVVLGGLGISLPVFNRGQEATAIATARISRLRTERTAVTRTIEAEVRGALATYDALRVAAAEYESTVLPLIHENERLALESYDVGQIGLGDLLLVRRDALDARRAFIDQLIETRLAEVELRARAGVWK